MSNREHIPANLKRKILVEAGHRCAIPTCRSTTTEIAHIIPYSEVEDHTYENLIALCPTCHTRYDQKGEIDRQSMYMYKDNLRFFIDKYSKFELDILEHLYKAPPDNGVPFLKFNSLLIKGILDEGYVQFRPLAASITSGGVKSTPDLLIITEDGRKYMEDFQTKRIGYEKE